MARLAFVTAGILLGAMDDPRVQGFIERIEANFQAAELSPGFISYFAEDTSDPGGFRVRPPVFADEKYAGRLLCTFTLWQNLESPFAFAYRDSHGEALSHRHEWFVKGDWPTYTAWWIGDRELPTRLEAFARYDQLYRTGPSPAAFDFKHPFDAHGNPTTLDRKAALTRAGQRTDTTAEVNP